MGDWLTLARARGYSLILLAVYAAAIVAWITLSSGLTDRNGKPLGTDFSSFYAAGSLALEGHAVAAYDMAAHYAREQQLFGAETPFYGWFYPPLFLLIAAPLALMPYALALAIWQGATLALYLAVMAAILRAVRTSRPELAGTLGLAALAFPAVFINLGHGQNGFLSAALLGGALLALPRRPLLAGVLFGLLAYKPQFALVIPVALLAASQWRAIGAAAITVAALAVVTSFAFGIDIWSSFAASTETSRKLLLQDGDVGFEKLQSVFAAVRMWGGGVPLAYAVQGAASVAVIGSVAWIWQSSDDRNVKSATVIVATLLASPHVLDYDLTILGPAIAFAVCAGFAGGFRNYEISILAAAWFVPLLARSAAGATGIPVGLAALIALYGIILHRAVDRATPSRAGLNPASERLAQA